MIEICTLTGQDLGAVLPSLAELRIRVFHEWPYLYDGTLEYEQKYLDKFSRSGDALIVVAKNGDQIVGASTASPLLGHADSFAEPFAARGYDPQRVFYFGESVLLPEYRGQGIGNAFFAERESHARRSGMFDTAAFCAVIRSPGDSRRPAGNRPLDSFWERHGFSKEEGLIAMFSWKELSSNEEIPHKMQFWVKNL